LTNDLKSSIIIIEVKERELINMEIKVNNKVVKIPQKEIDNLMKTLELTEQEAIQTWLDDNDYTTNEVVEELTKKAKDNKTTLINKARVNVKNKKITRERKENPTKALIIAEIFNKLTEIEGISQLKVENKEKLVTFSLNDNEYKLDLVQKRAKKA
jgi:chemotaxis signal transduction protein